MLQCASTAARVAALLSVAAPGEARARQQPAAPAPAAASSSARPQAVRRVMQRARARRGRRPSGPRPAPRQRSILGGGHYRGKGASGRRTSASSTPIPRIRAGAVSAVGEGALRRPSGPRARAAHALQGLRHARQFLTPYGVEFVEWPTAAHLHLRRRRAAHVPHHLHGRPHASEEPRHPATTAIPSAGGKATRSSSTASDSTRASGWIGEGCRTPSSCTRSSGSRAPTRRHEVRGDGRRSGRLHGAVDAARFNHAAWKPAPSCSNTSASRPTTRTS